MSKKAGLTLNECQPWDDGTLDTCVLVWHTEKDHLTMRYCTEAAWDYRDSSGELDFERFCCEVVIPDAEEELAQMEMEADE